MDNSAVCYRVAFLGGSYVNAGYRRVAQEPAMIAEPDLNLHHDDCFEVFTVPNSLFSFENHYGNVEELLINFGVDMLIFSVSSKELCRINDLFYATVFNVARSTPIHWRYRVSDQLSLDVLRGEVTLGLRPRPRDGSS